MNADPVAISALVATAGQFVLFWQRESARAKEAERREIERFEEFLRSAYEREQKASDECAERVDTIRTELHETRLELAQVRATNARYTVDIARLKAQMMQVLRTTPTNEEWDRAIAENPDMWQSIREGSK